MRALLDNPAPSLVGIGRLVSIDGQRRDGSAFTLKPTSAERMWLAWRGAPETGDLLIVRPVRRVKPTAADQTTAILHKRFHDAEPMDWREVTWTEPTRALEHLGFARSLSYTIPGRMPSNKQSAPGEDKVWLHHFGDFGGGVDERDDPRFWPGLAMGHDGAVYLLRKRGNRYTLDDWLIG